MSGMRAEVGFAGDRHAWMVGQVFAELMKAGFHPEPVLTLEAGYTPIMAIRLANGDMAVLQVFPPPPEARSETLDSEPEWGTHPPT